MTTLDPTSALTIVVVMGVAYAMAVGGVSKNALEWRRRQRVCPSCGRRAESCRCA